MLKQSYQRDMILITLLGVLFFGFMLGTRPLSAPDEGRYTEIPREMAATGDYVTPRLNGVKYFEKPPLMYWAGAASINLLGVNEWALRFWPAFFGLLTVLATYWMGLTLQSRRAGLYGAGLLSTCLLFYAHTRILILDMPISTFITLGLFSFHLSTREAFSKPQRLGYLMVFFVASALAVLSKGLIGAVLPGGVIVLWSCLTRRWDALKSAFHPLGLAIFLAIILPWHILAAMKNPEFFDFYIIHEHFTRYLDKVHNRYQPPWFFIPILIAGLFPWTFLVGSQVWRALKTIRTQETTLFLMLWAGFIFTFFSLSHSKLIPYILPVFPPLILITALELDRDNSYTARWPSIALAGFSGILLAGLPVAAWIYGLLSVPEIPVILGALMVILGAIIYYALKQPFKDSLLPIFTLSTVFLMVLNSAWPHFDTRSVKVLAQEIMKIHQPGQPIIAYGRYYQDLPPYVNQRIIVVGWTGELEFGMKQEDTSSWMMTKERFFRFYDRTKTSYIVTRKEFVPDLEQKLGMTLHILKTTKDDVLGILRK